MFKNVATIHAPRSSQNMSYNVKTSLNVGELVPVYVQEVLPGDSFDVNSTFVARLTSSFLRPVCDNIFIDFYYFFVPSRTVFNKWEQIFGENEQGAWAQNKEVSAPFIPESFTNASKSVGDYLEIAVGDVPKGVNILPFRAFAKIYDEWFRDQNHIAPMFIEKGDWTLNEMPNNDEWSSVNYVGKLPKVAKLHDVFTSSLPSTQKSLAPAYVPLDGFLSLRTNPNAQFLSVFGDNAVKLATNNISGDDLALVGTSEVIGNGMKTVKGIIADDVGLTYNITGSNLGVNLADSGVLTVPDLRYAFQVQRILERSARSGSRYTEFLLSAFSVRSPDARLQRSEYLGGKRMPLTVQQVASTVRGGNDYDELGALGGFSLSNGKCGFNKAFTEHGYIICTACCRIFHTYQQGCPKHFQRHNRFDYFDPALDHISEQPVWLSEIYCDGLENLTSDIFGYQSAWYDYRKRNDVVTGLMRSGVDNSLDIWHFADYYENRPFLNKQFIEETPDFVDRTIAVPSESLDQFMLDIHHEAHAIRRMNVTSVPGLIDHY